MARAQALEANEDVGVWGLLWIPIERQAFPVGEVNSRSNFYPGVIPHMMVIFSKKLKQLLSLPKEND